MSIRLREGKVVHEDVGTQVIGSLNIISDAVGSQHIANDAISYGAQIKDNIIGYGELTTGLQGTIDCAHGTIHIAGTVQTHVTSGSIDIRSSALPTGAATETTLAKLPSQGTFDHGRKSNIGTTSVQIGTLSFTAKLGVLVKAANSNYGRLFVGNSDVTADSADLTDGFELGAGESCLIKVNKVDKVYVCSTGTAHKAFWMAV